MKQNILLLLLLALLPLKTLTAQHLDKLSAINKFSFQLYFSNGFEQRALSIAERVSKAKDYHQQLLGFNPTITMLVLSKADWSSYTAFPVYGMPHYNDDKTLIVAAEDNPFWKSFLPPLETLPISFREQVVKAYQQDDNTVSMQAFFDLLAIHELGHAFHIQGGLTMQRKWMGELFCNILLHTYVAEKESLSLPALITFPTMVINSGTKEFLYTSLQDIEERYDEIGQRYPKNYGWYQCRWHAAAADIYNSSGTEVCGKLWNALNTQKEIMNDEQFASFLESKVDKSVANMMLHWNNETKK